jgi:hypothetical protein
MSQYEGSENGKGRNSFDILEIGLVELGDYVKGRGKKLSF